MNLSSAVRTVKSVVTANSPVLLVGTAIAGVVTTGVLAAKGGYKARGIIDEAQVAKGDVPLDLKEKVSLTWLCYAAPAVTGVTTIASVVGVHTIHTKRHAALAGLYAVTATKMDDYREKAEELLGSKKTQQLNDALGQSDVDRSPFDTREVVITGNGTELIHDAWSGRYFTGSVAEIEKALGDINLQLAKDGDAELNEFYDKVNLPLLNPMGSRFGWKGADNVQPRFGSVVVNDKGTTRSAVSFTFHPEPKDNLGVV